MQAAPQVATELRHRLIHFLAPLLLLLDTHLDARLVRTFAATIEAIIQFRHSTHGLLLSELGAYVHSPAHAPAGTKRLSNLLRSPKWTYHLLEQFLWQQAAARLAALETTQALALAIWDESVIEKAESSVLEGLCSVRSSTAARLKRIKPGYFNPPGGPPIIVPGMHWLGVLLVGRVGPPTLAAMRWWTSRGKLAADKRKVEHALLQHCAQQWGRRVLHVWDRSFAGGPWLTLLSAYHLRFIIRWPKGYKLVTVAGERRKAWQIARGKRTWDYREVWDARRHCWRKTGVFALPVGHAEVEEQLWLVISRPGKGREPWYLLTNEPISTVEDAWTIVFAYARRWQIEMSWRYSKSELAMESPRLWRWENRLTLLLMATLAYAFLLSLLQPRDDMLRWWLLRHWCHRTGKRSQNTPTPLYRLRAALSRLWLAYRPSFGLDNSG